MGILHTIKNRVPQPIKDVYHFIEGNFIAYYYGSGVQESVRITGITGTDGKTTTTYMLTAVLRKAGFRVAVLNGNVIDIDGVVTKNGSDNSTPSPWIVHSFIRDAVAAGCTDIIIEATSWGLSQNRLAGVYFDTAIITNISQEHLDLHGTPERYRAAKEILFARLAKTKKRFPIKKTVAIYNADDPSAFHLKKHQADVKMSYGLEKRATVSADKISYTDTQSSYVLIYDQDEKDRVVVNLPGRFNVYNSLAIVSFCLAYNICTKSLLSAMAELKPVPGRVNVIDQGQPFIVIVDFAHTPNSFRQLFESARLMHPKARLIAVFGSAGGRDTAKRGEQGKVAAELLDYFVLTTDDPRHENPSAIADEILAPVYKKVKKDRDYTFVADRKEAFRTAFLYAKPGDVVMLLSMGAYEYMYVGDGKIKWNDEAKAREVLVEMGYTQ